MLCFERAVQLDAHSFRARFHLGEVRWQLGRGREAMVAWREASERAPGEIAPRLALAEALLFVGELSACVEAAQAALTLSPQEPRAHVLRDVARFAQGDDAALGTIADLAARHPALFNAPAIASALARAWMRNPGVTGSDALAAALVSRMAELPWPLFAALGEHVVGAPCESPLAASRQRVVQAARERPLTAADIDGLRRLAWAALRAREGEAGRLLAEHYGAICLEAFRAPHPLSWPVRCAGASIRAAVILGPDDEAVTPLLAAIARDRVDAIALAVWIVGAADTAPPAALAAGDGPNNSRAGGNHDISRGPGARSRSDWERRNWNGPLDLGLARAIALDDPDVLLDGVGLAVGVGPVLAARPARAIGSVAVACAGAPLVDWVVDPAAPDAATTLLARLAAGCRNESTDCRWSPSEIADRWDEAVRLHRAGDSERAEAAYDQILAEQPGFAPAHFLRGCLRRDADDIAGARADFAEAVLAAPDYVDARAAAIRIATRARDFAQARLLAEAGLSRSPQCRPLLLALGEALLAARDTMAATQPLVRALALDPTDADAHYNLGVAAQIRGDVAEAARAYQRALAFRADFTDAHFNLGVLFQEQGNAPGAVAAYNRVIALDPKRSAAYKNLGETLLAAGRIDAFVDNFARFEAACPDSLALAVQALEACPYRADWGRLEHYLDGLRKERFRAADEAELVDCLEQLLYLLLFFDIDPDMLYRFARTYDQTAARVYGARLPVPVARRPGPARVGYLSGDFRDHVMGKQVWPVLSRHDRGRFEVYLYSTSTIRDEWTARFEGIAHRFVSVAGQREREAARRIAEDDLDILVDLSTHTRGSKPGILACKPARVQITHVASAGTLGLAAIDFKLTDHFADLPENQAFQAEILLPMEGCVYPYRHIEPAASHPFRREALGIAAGAVVIGAFVNPLKLSRRCLALWREVLQRLPNAKLALSPVNPTLRDVYVAISASGGIGSDRLLFLPQGRNEAENQARYTLVDFVLDPMPFGGVNGVLEPLDMGVPVVTLVGKRHGERTGYSILANLGVTRTVAHSGSEYVDIAVRLARDSAFAAEVRDAIRAGLTSSPLVDMDAHARHLEAAYLEALARKAPSVLSEVAAGC